MSTRFQAALCAVFFALPSYASTPPPPPRRKVKTFPIRARA
jgi:hypothetical protein